MVGIICYINDMKFNKKCVACGCKDKWEKYNDFINFNGYNIIIFMCQCGHVETIKEIELIRAGGKE